MPAITTRTFRSGNSEAVRLPAGIAFGPDTAVTVERHGNVITIRPVVDPAAEKLRWLQTLAELDALPKPSSVEVREPIEFPERPGL